MSSQGHAPEGPWYPIDRCVLDTSQDMLSFRRCKHIRDVVQRRAPGRLYPEENLHLHLFPLDKLGVLICIIVLRARGDNSVFRTRGDESVLRTCGDKSVLRTRDDKSYTYISNGGPTAELERWDTYRPNCRKNAENNVQRHQRQTECKKRRELAQ